MLSITVIGISLCYNYQIFAYNLAVADVSQMVRSQNLGLKVSERRGSSPLGSNRFSERILVPTNFSLWPRFRSCLSRLAGKPRRCITPALPPALPWGQLVLFTSNFMLLLLLLYDTLSCSHTPPTSLVSKPSVKQGEALLTICKHIRHRELFCQPVFAIFECYASNYVSVSTFEC